MFVSARRHHLHRHRQRIGEGGARRADVEAPGAMGADLVLDEAGGAREEHVGRHRADDDHADIVGLQAGFLDGLERRLLAEVRRRHARIDEVPLADAGALQDPFVGRLDELFEIGIGQQPRRHVGRQRGDPRPDARRTRGSPANGRRSTTVANPFRARRARSSRRRAASPRGRAASDPETRSG